MSSSNKERRWIEAESLQQNEEEEEDESPDMGSLFDDPDPHERFHFEFEFEAKTITISLRGYKAELGQTLHSTGLTLWRASELLCNYMVTHAKELQDKKVLELGAGLGLCGILAHHLRAKQVVLTDGDTDTLTNLRSNAAANCHPSADHRVSCRQLVWGEDEAMNEIMKETDGPVDVLLGSDIIYVEEILEPLWKTVAALLSNSGQFWLAYARRNVNIDLVLKHAERHGFVYTTPSDVEGVFVFTQKE